MHRDELQVFRPKHNKPVVRAPSRMTPLRGYLESKGRVRFSRGRQAAYRYQHMVEVDGAHTHRLNRAKVGFAQFYQNLDPALFATYV